MRILRTVLAAAALLGAGLVASAPASAMPPHWHHHPHFGGWGWGGVGIVIIYDAVVSLIILAIIKAVIGLKVSDEIEREGLDLALHGEVVQ